MRVTVIEAAGRARKVPNANGRCEVKVSVTAQVSFVVFLLSEPNNGTVANKSMGWKAFNILLRVQGLKNHAGWKFQVKRR